MFDHPPFFIFLFIFFPLDFFCTLELLLFSHSRIIWTRKSIWIFYQIICMGNKFSCSLRMGNMKKVTGFFTDNEPNTLQGFFEVSRRKRARSLGFIEVKPELIWNVIIINSNMCESPAQSPDLNPIEMV